MASRGWRRRLVRIYVVLYLVSFAAIGIVAAADLYAHKIPAVVVGGCIAILALANPADVVPPRPSGTATPPPGRSRFGAVLWLVGKVLAAGVAGYFSYQFIGAGRSGFDLLLAATAIWGWIATLIRRAGMHLRGLDVDWRFLRLGALPQTALVVALAFVSAGYAPYLADAAYAILSWVPVEAYRLFDKWWHIPVLPGLSTAVVSVVYLTVLVTLIKAVVPVLRGILGAGPAAYGIKVLEETPGNIATIRHGGFVMSYEATPLVMRLLHKRDVRIMRALLDRPCLPESPDQLRVAIVQSITETVPSSCHVCLDYRSVGSYRELDIRVTDTNDRPVAVQVDKPELLRLLAQLRSADYTPGRGAWMSLRMTFSPRTETHTRWHMSEGEDACTEVLRCSRDDTYYFHADAWTAVRIDANTCTETIPPGPESNRSHHTHVTTRAICQPHPDEFHVDGGHIPPYALPMLWIFRQIWIMAIGAVPNFEDSDLEDSDTTTEYIFQLRAPEVDRLDTRPEWNYPPDSQHYALDLEAFPRLRRFTPPWLRKERSRGSRQLAAQK